MQNDSISKIKDLLEKSHIGEIIEIDDPKKIGRVKIKVFGVFGDKNDDLGKIPKDDLPWSYPLKDIVFGSKFGTGGFNTPKMNSIVNVIFDDDIYHPKYFSLEEIDEDLQKVIKDDYLGFHSLMFDPDEKIKMYYSRKTGFLIDFNSSKINIKPDGSILVDHKQSTSTIELKGSDIDIVTKNSVNISTPNNITANSNQIHVNGASTDIGANPIYSSWNSEIAIQFLKILATGLDQKYPATPGQFVGILEQFTQLILSKTVKTSP